MTTQKQNLLPIIMNMYNAGAGVSKENVLSASFKNWAT